MNQMQGLQQHYSGMNGVKATVLRGIILPSSNTSVSSSSCSSVLGSVHSTLHGDGICSFTHADFQVSCQQVFYHFSQLFCSSVCTNSLMWSFNWFIYDPQNNFFAGADCHHLLHYCPT